MINYFGEIGGFNFILNRIKYIENPEQWIPVDIMANYLQGYFIYNNIESEMFMHSYTDILHMIIFLR